MFEGAFAALAELKARLKIGSGDTTDDAILTEMLKGVSGAIEACAGRRLRRVHYVTEYFAGGGDLIRVANFPIAAVHSVRESWTRDFETAGAYDELVAGTDYVLEAAAAGGRPGEKGWLRRLNGGWLGARSNPGMVQVSYTGGYKTPEEVAAQNATATVVAAAAFSATEVWAGGSVATRILRWPNDPTLYAGWTVAAPAKHNSYALFVFDLSQSILPTWQVFAATFRYTRTAQTGGSGTALRLLLLADDPAARIADLAGYSVELQALGATGKFFDGGCDEETMTTKDHLIHADMGAGVDPAANLALLNATMRRGFAAVLVDELDGTYSEPYAIQCCSPTHATPEYRPQLILTHRDVLADPFGVPGDLRHATLLQAAYDWHSRRNPGIRSEILRGASTASGISYIKDPADLLPAVRRVAEHYA